MGRGQHATKSTPKGMGGEAFDVGLKNTDLIDARLHPRAAVAVVRAMVAERVRRVRGARRGLQCAHAVSAVQRPRSAAVRVSPTLASEG